jgi:hypothetical protein
LNGQNRNSSRQEDEVSEDHLSMGSILGEKIAETPTVDIEAAPPCGANSDEKNDQKNHDHSGRADSELARSEGRSGPYFEPRKEKGPEQHFG